MAVKDKSEVRVYKKTGEDEWSSDYSLLNVTSIDVNVGMDSTKDSWTLKVPNQNRGSVGDIEFDDRVELYFYTGSTPVSSDLIISGNVNQIENSINNEDNTFTIEGSNRTEELLNVLVQLAFSKAEKDISQVVQEIIDKVNNQNRVTAGDDGFISTDIQQTKDDGSAFPKKVYMAAYKPAYELIENFSTDEYTKDGAYMFWMDSNNTFHWRSKKTKLSSDDYKFSEVGDNIRELNIEEGNWNVYNSVIVDVGEDCNGHGNQTLAYNPRSMVEAGTKWKFLDVSSTTPELITTEAENHPAKWSTGSDGEPTEMFPNSYPYTCSFPKLDSSYETTSSNWVVSNDNDFNLAIRRTARLDGKEKGQSFLSKHGEISYRMDLQLNGTNAYQMGEIAEITAPSYNLQNQRVRIKEISHNFSNEGWITVLNCEEDEET